MFKFFKYDCKGIFPIETAYNQVLKFQFCLEKLYAVIAKWVSLWDTSKAA